MPTPVKATLFEAIGGRDGVISLVGSFYERVLGDEDLAPFFRHVPMNRLRNMQEEFFCGALGGEAESTYKGRPIGHAHQALSISRRQFQRFTDHLFETLKGFPLSDDDRYDIIARVNLYSDDVIGMGGGLAE